MQKHSPRLRAASRRRLVRIALTPLVTGLCGVRLGVSLIGAAIFGWETLGGLRPTTPKGGP